MISSIISLILSIPKFLEWAEKFIAFINEIVTEIHNKNALKKMDQDIQIAESTKDTSELDELFDPGKKEK